MPLAFALLGLTVLLVTSGLKGTTIADVFTGKATTPLDPAGPKYDPTLLGADTANLTDVPGSVAGGLVDTAKGVGSFDGQRVALWIIPILKYARAHGWHGSVSSGYRDPQQQAQACIHVCGNPNGCSGGAPCAKPGTSNHQGAIFPSGAVDVTDAAQLSAILQASKYRNILVWAGAKDPPHFSHPHGGSY